MKRAPISGLAIAVVALIAAIVMAHWRHGPEFGADDHGQYLLHAKALVEGRPYTDIGFIHTPYSTLVAPIAEPPGLPVLIAGVFSVAGTGSGAARAILLTSFALFGLLVFQYFKHAASPIVAAIVTAWTLVALGRLHALDTMLADLPFCVCLWLAFHLADGAPVRGTKRLLLLTLAGAAAFTFRMAALPLLPAAATALLVRDGEERRGFLISGAAWTLAAVAVMWGLPAAEVLAGEALRSPAAILGDVTLNARAIWDGARMWSPLWLEHRALNLTLHSVLLVVAIIGAVIALRAQPRRFAYITAAWYLIMLVALPTRAPRYMWPLFPLMTYAFLTGAQWLLALVPRVHVARRQVLACTVATLVIVAGLARDVIAPAPRTFDSIPDVQSVRDVLRREDGGTGRVRVVVFAPRVVAWEDGLTTMSMFDAPPDEMLRVLREHGITHVVSGDAGTYAIGAAGIPRLVESRPGSFRELYRNDSFRVYATRDRALAQ